MTGPRHCKWTMVGYSLGGSSTTDNMTYRTLCIMPWLLAQLGLLSGWAPSAKAWFLSNEKTSSHTFYLADKIFVA